MALSTESLRQKMYSSPKTWRYPPPEGKRLLQVIVALRHGDRAPISPNAGDLVPDVDAWTARLPKPSDADRWDAAVPVVGPSEPIDANEAPFGVLTVAGAQQCEALGASIRESLLAHAPHLLPTESSHLRLRATNIRRTQQSVQNVVFGLLATRSSSSSGAGGGVDDLALVVPQPTGVPLLDGLGIAVNDFDMSEVLIPQPYACPALMERMLELKPAMEAVTSLEDGRVLCAVSEALGYPPPAAENFKLDQAREALVCAFTYDDPAPRSITSDMVEALLRINAQRWGVRYGDPIVARLGMGRLLGEIGNYMDQAASADVGQPPRVVLLSGHDSTIVPLLAALGLFNGLWPPYAAAVRLELGEAGDSETGAPAGGNFTGSSTGATGRELYARLLYNDEPLDLHAAMDLVTPADVAGWVPYPSFRAFLQERAVTHEEVVAACGADTTEADGGDTSLKDTLVGSGKKVVPGKDGE